MLHSLRLVSILTICIFIIVSACRKPDECIPACGDPNFFCIKGDCVCPGIVISGFCRPKLPGYVYGTVGCGCIDNVGFSFNQDRTVFMTYQNGTLTADYRIREDGTYSFLYQQWCNHNDIQTGFVGHIAEPVDSGMYITTQYLFFPSLEVAYECTSFFE